MKKIAIIAAMDQELAAIKQKFDDVEEKSLNDLVYYLGKSNQKEYILIKSCKSNTGFDR